MSIPGMMHDDAFCGNIQTVTESLTSVTDGRYYYTALHSLLQPPKDSILTRCIRRTNFVKETSLQEAD